jgi:hypothetical protein
MAAHGIGFKTADQTGQKMSIPADSLIRAWAGLSHVLLKATGEGHCALPVEMLKDEAGKLLLAARRKMPAEGTGPTITTRFSAISCRPRVRTRRSRSFLTGC